MSAAKGILASFAAGGLFGAGLLVSQMTNPTKIIEFLDLFRDPSLALVMIGALVTTYIGYRIVLKRPSPIMADKFHLPDTTNIDGRLISGAALFGIGWGLSGLCPGPALASISFAGLNVILFLGGMVGSVALFRMLNKQG